MQVHCAPKSLPMCLSAPVHYQTWRDRNTKGSEHAQICVLVSNCSVIETVKEILKFLFCFYK